MQKHNQFINQVHSWLNNYSYIVYDKGSEELERSFDNARGCFTAMRDFSLKVFPNASEKAKKDHYWNAIEQATSEMTINPEDFLVKFIPFFKLIEIRSKKWI